MSLLDQGMSAKPYIGMRVWVFDINRRVYALDERGRAVGGPIWREHWSPKMIVGETRQSWLVAPEWMFKSAASGAILRDALKVPKKDWPGNLATCEEDISRREFVEHRHRLADRVNACRDYEALKKVEAALLAAERREP